FLAAVLATVLVFALAVPVGASNSSFGDVPDSTTAVNAEVLRLMGVVDGTGGNQFQPGSNLTRAQFCTMVVKFMQKGDLVPMNATRTIFSDVTARHWGLGYINLAASLTVKDGEKEVPLISGVGNGKFEPDARITLGQAATILIRVLGYSSEQAGAVWPQSYMNLAKSIGLTDGVSAGTYDNITRAQAAQLFVNALTCKTGAGQAYYKSLGTATENVVLLAVDVDAEDGSTGGAVRTSGGTYLPKTEDVNPTALQGRRGALVTNDKQEIVTFVPDDSTSTTVTLSEAAQPTYVKGSNGTQYAISSSTVVYTADKTEGDTYVNAYSSLQSGSQITMFSERGKVVAVYAGGSMATSDAGAVVVTGSASAATFYKLTGGATNFTIQKNRQTISLSDIKPYDVVTYDSLSNTLIVSDLRLTCVMEDVSPSAKTPETITTLGKTFDVLESAWDTTKDFSVGTPVSLLLTADGKVAGVATPTNATHSTAIGMVSDSGAEVFLPNGGTLSLKGTVYNADKLKDRLVTLSSGSKGVISVSSLPSKTASGVFDVDGMKLGGYTVTAGVKVYEQVNDGAMVQVALGGLGGGDISGERVATYHLNTSDMVDYIVLENVTGNAYQYGMIAADIKTVYIDTGTVDKNGEPIYREKKTDIWKLVRSNTITFATSGYSGTNGEFIGVAVGTGTVIRSVINLTEVKNVSPSDFFQSQGINYVTVGGKTYQVSDSVECYRNISSNKFSEDNWFKQTTGQARLTACKAYSSDLTIYVDPIGEQVRIVAAN
ncbi:MAG: S-layer homology domain-containing protein, partial [Lawsonibacter sp.]|nr:S-layer homology domain-containing protein [Lawsonibacter sp.]